MKRLLVFVSVVVLVETIFFAALAPLLPDLSEELGLSKGESGFLVGAYALGVIAGAIPAGLLASRVGVKPVVLLGLVLISVACVGFGLADQYGPLVVARFIQGVGGALCWTGALAWLVSMAPRERRGEMIGYAIGAAIAGALLGPVLGWGAARFGRESAFAAVAGIAIVLAVWGLREDAPPPGERQPLRMLLTAVCSRHVLLCMWLLTLPALLFGVVEVLAPLELDLLGWGALGVAVTFLISAAGEAAVNPAVGRWSDRAGRLAPVRVGLVGAVVVSLVMPSMDNRWTLSLLVVLAGLAYGVFWTPAMAMLSEAWEARGVEHAMGFALMNFAWAPGNLVGAAAGAAVAEVAGDRAAYAILAALCVLTLLVIRLRSPRLDADRTGPAPRAG